MGFLSVLGGFALKGGSKLLSRGKRKRRRKAEKVESDRLKAQDEALFSEQLRAARADADAAEARSRGDVDRGPMGGSLPFAPGSMTPQQMPNGALPPEQVAGQKVEAPPASMSAASKQQLAIGAVAVVGLLLLVRSGG